MWLIRALQHLWRQARGRIGGGEKGPEPLEVLLASTRLRAAAAAGPKEQVELGMKVHNALPGVDAPGSERQDKFRDTLEKLHEHNCRYAVCALAQFAADMDDRLAQNADEPRRTALRAERWRRLFGPKLLHIVISAHLETGAVPMARRLAQYFEQCGDADDANFIEHQRIVQDLVNRSYEEEVLAAARRRLKRPGAVRIALEGASQRFERGGGNSLADGIALLNLAHRANAEGVALQTLDLADLTKRVLELAEKVQSSDFQSNDLLKRHIDALRHLADKKLLDAIERLSLPASTTGRPRRTTGEVSSFGLQRIEIAALVAARAPAVALIFDTTGAPVWGTGFLVDGAVFNADWPSQVLITNFHVVNAAGGNTGGGYDKQAMGLEQAGIQFLSADQDKIIRPKEILWSSGVEKLDISILALDRLPDGVEPIPVWSVAEPIEPPLWVVTMGYPEGDELAFGNGRIERHEKDHIRYSAGSAGGCSGGPVLEGEDFLAVAVHRLRDEKDATGGGVLLSAVIAAVRADAAPHVA